MAGFAHGTRGCQPVIQFHVGAKANLLPGFTRSRIFTTILSLVKSLMSFGARIISVARIAVAVLNASVDGNLS